MTIQTVEAVYEQGTFRIVQPTSISFQEGQRVRIVVDTVPVAEDILSLATSVFDGLSEQEVNDIDMIARERDSFFGGRS